MASRAKTIGDLIAADASVAIPGDGVVVASDLADGSVTTAKLADANVTIGKIATTVPLGTKNLIINGDMKIDQRNAGASVTPGDGNYTIDRWATIATAASKISIEQNAGSVTPPVGFSNYLGITSLSAYSVGAGDIFGIQQRIEGFNTSNLDWGTANAKTVTLSAWVYSSLTGTFGGSIINAAQNYSYPFTYTISSANTWTKINVTISGPTSGTWVGATNGIGIQVNFGIGGGSTYSGTSGAWGSQQKYTATGATSVVGTNGATFYITGVQLEVGDTATPFEHRPYDMELARCQRYYENIIGESSVQFLADTYSTGSAPVPNINIFYKQTKRASPTISTVGTFYTNNTTGSQVFSIGTISFNVYYIAAGTGRSYWNNLADSGWTASCEL